MNDRDARTVLRDVQLGMLALLLAAFALRVWVTSEVVLAWGDCGGCLAFASMRHDLGLLALFCGLSLAWVLLPRWLAWLAALAQGLLLLAIVADLVTLSNFALRLSLRDVVKFGTELNAVFGYTFSRLLGWRGLLALLGAALLGGYWIHYLRVTRVRRPLGVLATGLTAIVAVLAWWWPGQAWHPLPWTYRNLLEVNWPSSVDRPYSEAMRQRLLALPEPEPRCEPGLDTRLNLVVVLVESWSWYHSAALGDMDATPELDRLAAQGAAWDRFFSNGFTTDHGLVAMLGGLTPLPSVNRYRSLDAFAGYFDAPGSLPRRLSADGYRSLFFTTGDLGFLGKGEWLRAIGFDHVEGNEHPHYQGLPRYAFGAAHDGHLFDRFLQWRSQRTPGDAPYVAIVETVSTHPPFEHPLTGVQDEEGAFRFVDEQVARFVAGLREDGYFEDGLLVVTSDQRALAPLRQAERDAFGDAAPAVLPFVVLGPGFEAGTRVATPGQMQDFPASVDHLLTADACHAPGGGLLFSRPPRAPECILRPQGNQRDIVDAWCGQAHLRIRLDGDETRVVDGPAVGDGTLIEAINRQRVRQGDLDAELTTIL